MRASLFFSSLPFLAGDRLDQPPQDLAAASAAKGVKDEDFSIMAVGEARFLPPRPAP